MSAHTSHIRKHVLTKNSKENYSRLASIKLLRFVAVFVVAFYALASIRLVNASPIINEYPIPTSNAGPTAITSGPDGALWFTEYNTNSIGRVTTGGSFTEYNIPSAGTADIPDITTGPDGNLWFTDPYNGNYGSIGEISTSGAITLYPILVGNIANPNQIVAGPDGALWFTAAGGWIGRITTSGSISYYNAEGIVPYDITAGPDGNLWYTAGNYIGKMTTSGAATNYILPQDRARAYYITAGADGNLWFTDQTNNLIGQMSTSGTLLNEYSVPTSNASLAGITSGPDGALWFTELNGNNIGRITTSGSITEYSVPTANSGPRAITTGPDGNLWFVELFGNSIGQLIPNFPPAAPTDLSAASPTEIPSLTWDVVNGATSYNIYRDGSLYDTSSTNSYIDNGAEPDNTYSYYVTAVNNAGESTPSNTIYVEVGTQPSITSSDSSSMSMRQPYSFTVTTSGYPTPALSENGTLPSGISFADNGNGTATINGEAAVGTVGTYPITITANNGVGTPTTQNFTLTVTDASSAPTITSSNEDTETFGVPFSFTVTTDGYPVPTLKKSGALPPGVTFIDNGDGTATISGTPDESAVGEYSLNIRAKNSAGSTTQSFTLTITKAPIIKNLPSTITMDTGSPSTTTVKSVGYNTPSLQEVGSLPAGITFTDNGDGTATIAGTPATGSGGSYPITVTATNQLGSTSQATTIIVKEAPTITSSNSASASVGQAFSFQVTATGYPQPKLSKVGKLPSGLSWDSSTGIISGTPGAHSAGTYLLTINAKNSEGQTSQVLTLNVN